MPAPIRRKKNINSVVVRAVDFMKMSTNNLISLNKSSQTYMAKIDEDQIYRVLINLIKNSEESFMEKKVKNPDFKGKINIDIVKNNDYIVISVNDNGTGITDTKKAMTPFYTTKKTGTGLGLAIASKIINEHSGELNIVNNKLEGINIKILLPCIYET